MLRPFIHGRVCAFIDAENVFYSQRTLGWKISYQNLMEYLRSECGEDVKCFVYTGIDEHNIGQRKFLDMLEINGYIVRTKVVKKIVTRDGSFQWKSNLDIELAFEMDDMKEKYDTALLFSGDSDFSVPVDRIKRAGKRIIVLYKKSLALREARQSVITSR